VRLSYDIFYDNMTVGLSCESEPSCLKASKRWSQYFVLRYDI